MALPTYDLQMTVAEYCDQARAQRAGPTFVALPDTLAAESDGEFCVRPTTMGDVRTIISSHPLKRGPGSPALYYYVVDGDGVLIGVLPDEIRANNHDHVEVTRVMIKSPALITLQCTATLDFALDQLVTHSFRALPVVDASGKLCCILDFDAVRGTGEGFTEQQLREELRSMLGYEESSMRGAGIGKALWLRGPWLAVTLVAGILCALCLEHYGATMNRLPLFLAFLPLVLALGDAVCHQASSVAAIQQAGTLPRGRMLRRWLRQEFAVSGVLALTTAALIAAFALAWFCHLTLAAMLGLSIASAVTLGGIIGYTVPTVLRWSGRDPHGAGGPISLGLADIASTASMIAVGVCFLC